MNSTLQSFSAPAAAAKQAKKRNTGRKKPELASNAPIFLRKTYTMIDTADPEIASWSDNGYTFVVKDTEKFATEVIPEFFKHNNFSSFVRQLNFYGFRKIKSDPLRIKDAEDNEESKFWKFRHEKFQQGRPDLLSEIRKSNHNESADKQEVDSLKCEVSQLRDRLSNMTTDMERLTKLVSSIMHAQQFPAKKRKLQHPHSVLSNPGIAASPAEAAMQLHAPTHVPSSGSALTDRLVQFEHVDQQLAAATAPGGEVPPVAAMPPAPTPAFAELPPVAHSVGRQESIGFGSIGNFHSTEDDAMLAALLASEPPMDEIQILEGTGVPESIRPIHDVSPYLMDTLRNALANLPTEMQEMFVDRTVNAIAQPDNFNTQIEALTSLSVSAAEEAKRRLAAAGKSPSDPKMIPVASAVLGAYLARFSGQKQAFEESQKMPPTTTNASFMQM